MTDYLTDEQESKLNRALDSLTGTLYIADPELYSLQFKDQYKTVEVIKSTGAYDIPTEGCHHPLSVISVVVTHYQ